MVRAPKTVNARALEIVKISLRIDFKEKFSEPDKKLFFVSKKLDQRIANGNCTSADSSPKIFGHFHPG